jgi:hypothetical protein
MRLPGAFRIATVVLVGGLVLEPTAIVGSGLRTYRALSGMAVEQETETVDRTVRLPDDETPRLRNLAGEGQIMGTTGRGVMIQTVRPQLDGIQLTFEVDGSTISIDADGGHLRLHTPSGDVQLTGE